MRHPDVEVPGVIPESSIDEQRARGWYRVSEWETSQDRFVLAEFGPDLPDLDEPAEVEFVDEPIDQSTEESA